MNAEHVHLFHESFRVHPHMVKQVCRCGWIRYVESSGPRRIVGRWFRQEIAAAKMPVGALTCNPTETR